MPSSLEGTTVFVAMPCLTDPTLYTTMSLIDTQEACYLNGVKAEFGFATGSLVHHARNILVDAFLKRKESLLFWIDADVKWTPADFWKLIIHSLKHEIVLGVYPRRREPTGYFIQFVDPDKEPDENGLVEIVHTGMGFSCMRRSVVEHMAALAPKLKHGEHGQPIPAIFRQDDDGIGVRGEDYAFWADCREQGYKIMADATICIGHVGRKIYQCSSSVK
jgi:hypothetical protein